jgi:hypothetical protein
VNLIIELVPVDRGPMGRVVRQGWGWDKQHGRQRCGQGPQTHGP